LEYHQYKQYQKFEGNKLIEIRSRFKQLILESLYEI
jgi:hypothetical protein